jgi:hypothetical protein
LSRPRGLFEVLPRGVGPILREIARAVLRRPVGHALAKREPHRE